MARFAFLGAVGGAVFAAACNGGGGDPMASETGSSPTIPGDSDDAPTTTNGTPGTGDTSVSGGTVDVPTGGTGTDSSTGATTIDGTVVLTFTEGFAPKSGDQFNRTKLGNDIIKINNLYKDRGYAYVNVTPLTAVDVEKRAVDLTFDLQTEIAKAMGYADRPGRKDVERFMKRYFLVAANVSWQVDIWRKLRNARDAASFRQSQSQIAADIARAVAAGRRSL